MFSQIRHTAAVALLLLYSFGFVAAEFGHSHHAAPPATAETVSAHECGSHERHIPPDRMIPCPACSPGSMRIGLPPALNTPFLLVAARTERPAVFPFACPGTFRSASGERAPPPLILS